MFPFTARTLLRPCPACGPCALVGVERRWPTAHPVAHRPWIRPAGTSAGRTHRARPSPGSCSTRHASARVFFGGAWRLSRGRRRRRRARQGGQRGADRCPGVILSRLPRDSRLKPAQGLWNAPRAAAAAGRDRCGGGLPPGACRRIGDAWPVRVVCGAAPHRAGRGPAPRGSRQDVGDLRAAVRRAVAPAIAARPAARPAARRPPMVRTTARPHVVRACPGFRRCSGCPAPGRGRAMTWRGGMARGHGAGPAPGPGAMPTEAGAASGRGVGPPKVICTGHASDPAVAPASAPRSGAGCAGVTRHRRSDRSAVVVDPAGAPAPAGLRAARICRHRLPATAATLRQQRPASRDDRARCRMGRLPLPVPTGSRRAFARVGAPGDRPRDGHAPKAVVTRAEPRPASARP